MKDYVPYIKRAMEKYADYKDIIDDVVQQVGNENERTDIEDSVVSYKHITDDSIKSMWATDDNVPDIKADIEEAFSKEAFVDPSQTPGTEQSLNTGKEQEIMQKELNDLLNKFLQSPQRSKIAPGVREATKEDVQNFLEAERKMIYFIPFLKIVNEHQNKTKPLPKEILTNKRATSLLNELVSDLENSGEKESADVLKKML